MRTVALRLGNSYQRLIPIAFLGIQGYSEPSSQLLPGTENLLKRMNAQRLGLVLSVFAMFCGVGMGSQSLGPTLIEGLIQGRGMSVSLAGWVQSIELACTAAAAIFLAPHVARLPIRRTLLLSCAVAAAFHFLSAFVLNIPALLILRALAGIAAGICLSTGNAMIAAQRNPDSLFGAVIAVAGLAYGPPLLLMSLSANTVSGPYLWQAAWTLLMVPFLLLTPKLNPVQISEDQSGQEVPRLAAALILGAFLLFMLFSSGIWFFAGQVTAGLHLSASWLGNALWGGTILGVLSAAAASFLGLRIGRLPPLIGGIVVTGISSYVVFTTTSPMMLAISFLGVQASYNFALPFVFGACSHLDKSGRILSAASSCMLVGGAIAPAIVGHMSEAFGFSGMASMSLIANAVVAVLFVWAMKTPRGRIARAFPDPSSA